MKTSNWLQLAAVSLLFALFVILPYLPGPPNKLSIGLMALGQFTGFFGVILLPIGFVWAIVEYQKRWGAPEKLNNWNSGFYFAIAATVFAVLIVAVLTAGLYMEEGIWVVLLSVLLVGLALWKLLPRINNLRKQASPTFNPAPLYLLCIPIFALVARLFILEPVADRSRSYAILHGKYLVNAIEDYHTKEGRYPDSLAQLLPNFIDEIPTPNVMGFKEFLYEKTPDAYQVSFWQHLGATEELVVYNKNNQHQVKYKEHNKDADTGIAKWRYYWLD